MSHTSVAIRREILWILIALTVGVLLLPPLIWVAGSRTLGPYAAGSVGELFDHFFRGLAQGGAAFWIVALGPYVFLLVLRLLIRALRSVRAGAHFESQQ